jgi:hypothetical protein
MSTHVSQRTPDDVRRFVLAALARSTRQWVPGREADSSALQKVHAEFNSSLIEPTTDFIEVEPHVAEILNIESGSRQVWFVTEATTQRVFLDEPLDSFGVAWGPDAATGKYIDLGFRTEDPIDAFLA